MSEPEAAFALRRLIAELSAREDETFPCQLDPDSHYDDDRISDAITACGRCPLIEECDAFADANRERHGVWGGRDRNPKHETTAGSPERRSERPADGDNPEDADRPGGRHQARGRGEGASKPQARRSPATDRTTPRVGSWVSQGVSVGGNELCAARTVAGQSGLLAR